MTRDDAAVAVRLLCNDGKVPQPLITWTHSARRGRYYRGGAKDPLRRGRIAIGPRCWRGVEATLLHELAHHFAHERQARLALDAPSRLAQRARLGLSRHKYAALYPHLKLRPRGEAHGPQFVAALKGLARVWYGDETRYDWATEYKSLRRACE